MDNDTTQNQDQALDQDSDVQVDQQEASTITYDQFQALDMRVGTIRFVEPVEGTDKLLRFLVEFSPGVATMTHTDEDGNEYPVRQIVSGIHLFYPEYEKLVGKQVLYVINLEPRMIRGVESQGMLMAVGDNDCIFMTPERAVAPGSEIH